MAESAAARGRFGAAGIEVQSLAGTHAAVLRYFEPEGPFAGAVAAVLGERLPSPRAAAAVTLAGDAGAELILAWTRPTETLVLAREAAPLEELTRRLAAADGGHVVELTGALAVLKLTGTRIADLMARLGGAGVPQPREARRGRLADVAVLALSVRADEVLLIVDRSFAAHLTTWIAETLVDWAAGA